MAGGTPGNTTRGAPAGTTPLNACELGPHPQRRVHGPQQQVRVGRRAGRVGARVQDGTHRRDQRIGQLAPQCPRAEPTDPAKAVDHGLVALDGQGRRPRVRRCHIFLPASFGRKRHLVDPDRVEQPSIITTDPQVGRCEQQYPACRHHRDDRHARQRPREPRGEEGGRDIAVAVTLAADHVDMCRHRRWLRQLPQTQPAPLIIRHRRRCAHVDRQPGQATCSGDLHRRPHGTTLPLRRSRLRQAPVDRLGTELLEQRVGPAERLRAKEATRRRQRTGMGTLDHRRVAQHRSEVARVATP